MQQTGNSPQNESNMHDAAVIQQQTAIARDNRKIKRATPLLLFACLALAILTVLLVPLLVGGAAPADSSSHAATAVSYASQNVASPKAAEQALGFAPRLPATLPEGYSATAYRTLENGVFEVEYSTDKGVILFRTAPGKEDLSGDLTEYAYTLTETVDGVARSYAGVAEQKLSLAVWADDTASYAIISPEGADAQNIKTMAESVA